MDSGLHLWRSYNSCCTLQLRKDKWTRSPKILIIEIQLRLEIHHVFQYFKMNCKINHKKRLLIFIVFNTESFEFDLKILERCTLEVRTKCNSDIKLWYNFLLPIHRRLPFLVATLGGHSFGTYAKSSQKLTFLTPSCAQVRVRIKR